MNATTVCCFFPIWLTLLRHAGSTVLQFTIPGNPNIRAFLDLTTVPALPTLSHSIVHGPLGSLYSIEVNYFAPGCQGTAVTVPVNRTITLPTSDAGGGLDTSTITNTLANIKAIIIPPFFGPTVPPVVGRAQYQYCVEFVLKGPSNVVIDQARYDVKLVADLIGVVSTGTVVVTDIDTNPAATTFTASVTVCNPTTGALVTSNFFRGDSITFCFKSNSFPQASITNIGSFALALTAVTPATSVVVTPGTATTGGSFVVGNSCVSTPGVATCRLTVLLSNNAAFTPLFPVPPTSRAVTASGTLTMKFGNTRRKAVRVLFQQGEVFDRNTKTEFVVEAAKKEERNCRFLFPWLMCLISDIFGAIF
jgi:hypothetical protein